MKALVVPDAVPAGWRKEEQRDCPQRDDSSGEPAFYLQGEEAISHVVGCQTQVRRYRALSFVLLPNEAEHMMGQPMRYELQRQAIGSEHNESTLSSGLKDEPFRASIALVPEQHQRERVLTEKGDDRHQKIGHGGACMICVSEPLDAACAPCGHLAAYYSS
ncbi:hypothetical protein BBJ28_00023771 [Nothophytophthora sp. Chile5]|nr:hypothetical protein BBJ28_00023771 [Nothophytophthora sp. Chile5]